MKRGYRSRNRILLDLLRTIKASPDGGSTSLLYGANLNYERLLYFLQELVDREMVLESEGEAKRYRLTTAGQQLLTELDRVERFMTNFGMRL